MGQQASSEKPTQGVMTTRSGSWTESNETGSRHGSRGTLAGSEQPTLWLSAEALPGETWSDSGYIQVWASDEADGRSQRSDKLLAVVRWLAETAGGIQPARETEGGAAVYTMHDFVRAANVLARADTGSSDVSAQSAVPGGWQVTGAFALFVRGARLAQKLVQCEDVIAFAAPSDLKTDEVIEMCFRLAEGAEDGWTRWLSHDSAYLAIWLPAWTSAALRGLRRMLADEAEHVWREGWRHEFGWRRRQHGVRILDKWLWQCVDHGVRASLAPVASPQSEVESLSPYRVLYRGEAELMARWQNALWALDEKDQLFAADGWLLRRLLSRGFVDTGWRGEWLEDTSGRADCHLEFEVVPPPADRPTGDWQLQYIVAHNIWPERVPLSRLWSNQSRKLRVGRQVLMHPDEWILPLLLEAGEHYEPILQSLREPGPGGCRIAPEDVADFALHGLPKLRAAGFIVRTADFDATRLSNVRIRVQVRRGRERAQTRKQGLHRGQGWFDADQLIDFDWTLAVDDEIITSEEFERLVDQRTPYVRLGGSWKLVPIEAILSQLNDIGLTAKSAGAAEFSRAVLIGQESEEDAPVELEVDFAEDAMDVSRVVRFFLDAEKPAPVLPPRGFQGVLRHYQQTGYEWLLHLRKLSCGACLADDMGLGKTIQVLAYLLNLKENREQQGPHLLICPTSLLQNWRAEIARFSPDLTVHVHHGAMRNDPLPDGGDRLADAVRNCDLIMTTYAIAVRDADILQAVAWDTVIADEAQNIKNADTKQAQAVHSLRARHRVALTGTPVENRLEELWSIFHFTNPGYLGGITWFRKKFAGPVDARPDSLPSRQLHRLIRPLLLRRSKSDPAIQVELPEKWEVQEYASLTSEQAALYQSIVNRLFTDIDLSRTDLSRRGRILAALVRLKQICDHPCLVEGGRGDVRRSGKLGLLLELLEDVVDEGAAALVFTQFRDMGELLCDSLAERYPWRPKFLHGGLSAAARGKLVEDFQSGRDPSPVLVLSLKAGGVGLNLTRANYVFHYDRWWNPAVEDQATDRVFRIGQTKNVQVHKLICAGTLEERIDQLITSKRQLSAAVVGDHAEGWITELDDEALRELFALSADAAMEEELL